MPYWKDYVLKNPSDPLGPRKISEVEIGAGIPPEAPERLVATVAPHESLVEQKEETAEEAKTNQERVSLRMEQNAENLRLQEDLVNQAVKNGILADKLRPHSTLKYSDVKGQFVPIESGNCLPKALLLAIPNLHKTATGENECKLLQHRVAGYFRKHGYIMNGDGDCPKDPESKRRVIPAVPPQFVEEDEEGIEEYRRATTVVQYADIMERKRIYSRYPGEVFLTCAAMSTNSRIIVFRCLNPSAPSEDREYDVDHFGTSAFEAKKMYFLLLSGVKYDALITTAESLRRLAEGPAVAPTPETPKRREKMVRVMPDGRTEVRASKTKQKGKTKAKKQKK